MTIYSAEKALKDNEAKIPAELKDSVNAKITALRGVKDGSDKASIETALQELSAEMSKIGEAMAKAGATPETETSAEPQPEEIKPEGEESK